MEPSSQEAAATPKQQVVERVRQAVNVLVTVRANPSVDELAACIGFTLMLNKLGKHATAVFSGEVPSTLEFLKPEETLETNTDSLRDFIISLDKSKADKLRYKVEENVVRIFITPYRTSITEKDLEFTQGDFNVDVVVALGVTQREELDQAITAHGRILHDAAVVTIIAGQRESTLGTVNWQEPAASSLSEMLVSISEAFQGGLIDSQMATAFLTGIVSETERFSNPKTTPKVMTMAAQLMAAGANQQLIANELQKATPVVAAQPLPTAPNESAAPLAASQDDGSLSIAHEDAAKDVSPTTPPAPVEQAPEPPRSTPEPELFLTPAVDNEAFNPLMPSSSEPPAVPAELPAQTSEPILPPPPELVLEEPHIEDGQIHIDEHGNMMRPPAQSPKHKVINPLPAEPEQPDVPPTDPGNPDTPPFSSTTTATPDPTQNIDPLTSAAPQSLEPETVNRGETITPDASYVPPAEVLPPVADLPAPEVSPDPTPEVHDTDTLLDIEKTVHSPHIEPTPPADLDSARSAVIDAISQAGYDSEHPEPRADVGAQYGPQIQAPEPHTYEELRLPSVPDQQPPTNSGTPPPPVPPPLMPQQ